MATVEIRAAQPHEAERVVDMYEWLFAPPGSRPADWDPARAAGALRGVIASEAADLAVHPERRSLGIGKRLLDEARRWAKDRGATHLELDSAQARTDAHRFYMREGSQPPSLSFRWEL